MTALTSFSTAGLPVEERLDRWERHNAEQLIGLRCRTLDGAELDATEVTRTLPSIQLGRVQGSAHVVERTSSSVVAHPTDAVAIYLVLAGSGFFHNADGAFLVDPGHLVICDADRPFMRGFTTGLTELVVRVPRATVAEMTGSASVGPPMVIQFGPGPTADLRASALARVVARGLHVDAEAGSPAVSVESEVLDLVRSILDADHRVDTAVWAQIEVFVARKAADPGLSAADIAAAVGVSTRQLSRLFAARDTSVAGYVLSRRLDRAHRALNAATGPRPTVGQVAAASGFTSPAHFSRSFRAEFGSTPSQVRHAARDGV